MLSIQTLEQETSSVVINNFELQCQKKPGLEAVLFHLRTIKKQTQVTTWEAFEADFRVKLNICRFRFSLKISSFCYGQNEF